MNILVAEDDEGFVSLMREILSSMPEHQTTYCQNGMEGWWHLTDPKVEFDLAILDINMPLVDGLTLLGRIRQNAKLQDLAVIMSTGLTARQKIAEAGALRVSHYLMKPFAPSMLIDKIKQVEGQLGLAVREVRIA